MISPFHRSGPSQPLHCVRGCRRPVHVHGDEPRRRLALHHGRGQHGGALLAVARHAQASPLLDPASAAILPRLGGGSCQRGVPQRGAGERGAGAQEGRQRGGHHGREADGRGLPHGVLLGVAFARGRRGRRRCRAYGRQDAGRARRGVVEEPAELSRRRRSDARLYHRAAAELLLVGRRARAAVTFASPRGEPVLLDLDHGVDVVDVPVSGLLSLLLRAASGRRGCSKVRRV